MDALNSTITQTIPTQNLSQIFNEKITITAFKVIEVVMTLLRNTQDLKIPEFVDTHITPNLSQLTELDERTAKFFKEMMIVITEQFQTMPSLMASFKNLNEQFPELAGKIVVTAALPFIKELITDLDSINRCMVDQAIGL